MPRSALMSLPQLRPLLPNMLLCVSLEQDPAWTGTYGMPRPNVAAMAVFPEDPQGEFVAPPALLVPPAAPPAAPPPPQQSLLPAVSLKPKDPRATAQQQQQQQQPSQPAQVCGAEEGYMCVCVRVCLCV